MQRFPLMAMMLVATCAVALASGACVPDGVARVDDDGRERPAGNPLPTDEDPTPGEGPAGSNADAGTGSSTSPDAGTDDPGVPDIDAPPWTPGPAGMAVVDLQQQLDTSGRTCSEDDWLQKYFRYRRRLHGDGTAAFPGFVPHTDGPGGGMLPTLRRPNARCDEDWWFLDAACTNLHVPQGDGLYEWGDATIWMGWYLATLATEYAVFHDLGLSTEQTAQDLREALHAIDRVDEAAEAWFGAAPARDGFFQRDDVPPGIMRTDDGTSPRFPRDADGMTGFGCARAQTSCENPGRVDGGYFESMDQVVGLLLGWRLVDKYVPEDVIVDGVRLRHAAQEQTHRVVNRLRDHGWKIIAPDGTSPPNAWGGDATPLSDVIAEAADAITHNAFGVDHYSNGDSNTVGAAAWAGLDASWLVQTNVNKTMALKLASITDRWSDDRVARRALDMNVPIWPMIRALLHDTPPDELLSNNVVDALLQGAPCDGPCWKTPGCAEVAGWQGWSRWESPGNRAGDINGQYGEYNGTDYMLLHNLAYLLRGGHYRMQVAAAPSTCATTPRIEELRRAPSSGARFDLRDPCASTSLVQHYCGRDFASWIDDSIQGSAQILVGDQRLVCTTSSCVLEDADRGAAVDGSDGPDLFLGTDGDDFFEANGGNDCMLGFGGNDRLEGGRGVDELHGGPGNDELCGESCSISDLDGEPDQLFGDGDVDTMRGGPGGDELYGGSGNDVLDGDSGEDFVYGDIGDDVMHGGGDRDILVGGDGNDTIYGDDDDDSLKGEEGRDRLDGGWGDDGLIGGPGDDFLKGSDGNDTLWGEDGDDRVCGNCGDDDVNGGYSVRDQCEASGSFCITGQSDHEEGCGVDIRPADCRDADFDAW